MKASPNKFLTKIILLSIFGRTIFVAQNLVNCIFVCSIGEYCPVVTKQINFLSLSCFNHFTFYALSHISPFTVVSVFQQRYPFLLTWYLNAPLILIVALQKGNVASVWQARVPVPHHQAGQAGQAHPLPHGQEGQGLALPWLWEQVLLPAEVPEPRQEAAHGGEGVGVHSLLGRGDGYQGTENTI